MTTSNNLLPSCSIVITEVNEVQFRVGKVDPFVGHIQSQAIGPINFSADYCAAICTIHSNTLYSWIFTPVSPKQPTGTEKNKNSLSVSNFRIDGDKIIMQKKKKSYLPFTGIQCHSSRLSDIFFEKYHAI